jgi:casein kinase II subunit beta
VNFRQTSSLAFYMESENSDDSDDTSMSDMDEDMTWVEWFCRLKGNEFFVEVDDEYIQDDFNLTGLSQIVPYYDDALGIILDEDDQDQVPEEDQAMLETACQMLYGLVHARYLLTTKGIQALHEKYVSGVYGLCWNETCASSKKYTLPMGSDLVGQGGAHVFCPNCGECYVPRNPKLTQLDGAYFGSSAAHMLVLQFKNSIEPGSTLPYTPLLYGFRIFPGVRDMIKERSQSRKATDNPKPIDNI